jgi:uncharacterized protein (TIGR00255 family)
MLRSMTGFGRYFLEESGISQTWEVRSVNSRYLDLKWRLPQGLRNLESALEKVVRRYCSRGRVELALSLKFDSSGEGLLSFDQQQAGAMLEILADFAAQRGDHFVPDYNRLLNLAFLWEDNSLELESELGSLLEKGLILALEDWNESRVSEARALEKDLRGRILRMNEWVSALSERAPGIREERFAALRERLEQVLAEHSLSLDEGRFCQEMTILADKLDVNEELVRLGAHLERLGQLMGQAEDLGRRLDFTLQECFREINTCGNKIQDAQISRLVVDFKNELEKCREQVQNIE